MKKAALIVAPILIILVLGGSLIAKKSFQPPQVPVITPTPTVESVPVQTLEESNPYGVDLTPRSDKKAVSLGITSFPVGLKIIEYELTYEAKEGPRGVLGTINYKNEDKIERQILLGTCSKNVCRYDEGVSEVTLTIVFRAERTEKFQGKFSL
ncbi:MAG: hypothetical protein Q8P89_00095 [bacterium]|nr:hypothetical protein [bacterium]